ncbi:hypothetical protein [Bradyrhizobium sp. NAS80.1]|uniref:hypothetical protein n=1 Tax=Bradyrhizobium sp. NAS80.1 TaxID=1680159 RepID=UPI000A061D08|nr:hypothetical protein [Bradyrhizobium sp. NAS80.1]
MRIFAITLDDRCYGGVYAEDFFYSYSIGSAYVCAAVVFIVFAAFGETTAWRPIAFVGVISYSTYLMSPFVMVWIHRYVWLGDRPLRWLAFVTGIVTASICVSWMTHSLVEKPWISSNSAQIAGLRSFSSPVSAGRAPHISVKWGTEYRNAHEMFALR